MYIYVHTYMYKNLATGFSGLQEGQQDKDHWVWVVRREIFFLLIDLFLLNFIQGL